MYKLRIEYLQDGSILQDWYGDSVLLLSSDHSVDDFLKIMEQVMNGVDLTKYVGENNILDVEFYKDVINVFADDDGGMTDGECLADLMDIAENDKATIFRAIWEYEDLVDGEIINKILENTNYNFSTVGYSPWGYAFYIDGFDGEARRLWDGYGFYDVSLLDENYTILNAITVDYGSLSTDDIDEILEFLDFDGTYEDVELIGEYDIISNL